MIPSPARPASTAALTLRELLTLTGLLTLTAVCACKAPEPAVEVEQGVLSPGSHMSAEVIQDDGPSWSLEVRELDLVIRIDGRMVVLEGWGTQRELRYELRETEPPEYTFHAVGRPRVRWRGLTLEIEDQRHALTRAGLYRVGSGGILWFEESLETE